MRKRIIKWSIGAIGLAILTLFLLVKITWWFDEHQMIWQPPLQISLHKPLQIVDRELLKPTIIEYVNELPTLKNLTPIEEYICEVFGPYECKIALSVARAESGMRADAFNTNTNKSLDLGIFQVNSVHWEKDGCHLTDLVDPYKNVDCAKKIYDASGWNAWSVWKNGAFKEQL